jgi:hypothetical protein
MLPFNKCHIFTLSLKLSTFPFTSLFGHHLIWGRQFFTKWKTGKHIRSHKDLNTSDDNVWLTASLHQLSCGAHMWELKIWFLKFFTFFIILFWLCLIKPEWNEATNKADLLYFKIAGREDFQCFQNKEIISVWGDRCANYSNLNTGLYSCI